jgi:hypothetical protein
MSIVVDQLEACGMSESNFRRFRRFEVAHLCVWDILEMPDVGICIVETPDERTSSGIDSQIGLRATGLRQNDA